MDDGSSLKRDCSDGNAMKDLNALFACKAENLIDKSIIRSNFIKSMFRKFEKDIDNDQRNDILITKKDWAKIPKNYKSVWSSDNIHGTSHNGKKTWMKGENGMTVLLIENSGFKII